MNITPRFIGTGVHRHKEGAVRGTGVHRHKERAVRNSGRLVQSPASEEDEVMDIQGGRR